MKLRISILACVLLVAFSGAAFAGGQNEGTSGKPMKLEMWTDAMITGDPSPFGEPMRKFVEVAKKEYPNIALNLVYVPERDLLPRFMAAFSAKNPPDITVLYKSSLMKVVKSEYVRPLDDLFAKYTGKDNFLPTTLDGWKYNGKLYGIPGTGEAPFVFFYYKNLYKNAGLSAPDTWDDVIRAGKAVTGGNRWGYGHAGGPGYDQGPSYFQIMVLSAGGDIIKDGKAVFNSQPGYDVAQMQVDWIYKYKISPPSIAAADDEAIEAGFRSGVYASYLDGWWEYKQMQQDTPDIISNVGVAAFPRHSTSAKHVSYSDLWALILPSTIAQAKAEAAFKLIMRHIEVADQLWVNIGGFFPTLKNTKADYGSEELNKLVRENIAPTIVPLPRIESYPELNDIISTYMGKVLMGEMSPKQGMDQAASKFNSDYAVK